MRLREDYLAGSANKVAESDSIVEIVSGHFFGFLLSLNDIERQRRFPGCFLIDRILSLLGDDASPCALMCVS